MVHAVGRTGFWSGGGTDRKGGNTYLERVERRATSGLKPSLVVLQASQNDYPASASELTTKVRETVLAAKKFWPQSQVVVLGPSAPLPKGNNLVNVNTGAFKGASDSCAIFLNGMGQGWMTADNGSGFAYTDGWHGHVYLASKIKETLDAFAAAS